MFDLLLAIITILVDLIGLGITIWLGFLLLTLGTRRKDTWIATGLMWGFSFVFFLLLLQLAQPLVPEKPWLPFELLRWVLIPIPLAWFWIGQHILPAKMSSALGRYAPIGVGAAIVLLIVSAAVGPLAQSLNITPYLWEWVFYPAYMVTTTLLLLPLAIISWRGQHLTSNPAYRDAARAITVASLLALVATLYRVSTFWVTPDLTGPPALPGDILLVASIIVLGTGIVLRRIGDGETNAPAFLYALANATAMSLLYSIVVGALALYLDISWVILVVIVPLAVTTHWLTDWLRASFDMFFYRAPVQRLRGDLRHLLRTLDQEEDLERQLRPLLVRVAGQVDSPSVAVILPDEEGWHITATYPLDAEPIVPASLPPIAKRSVIPLPPPPTVTAGPAWAVPLPIGAKRDGLLVAWSGTARSLSDLQLQLLDEAGYQLATLLQGWRDQGERLHEIESLVNTYREEAAVLRHQQQELTQTDSTEDGAETDDLTTNARRWVEEVARNLHNVAYLGQHPIAQLHSINPYLSPAGTHPVTHLERGQAVRRLMEVLIERLRPAATIPSEPLPAEWRLYVVLHAAYIEKVPNREIMSRLYIGEGTFHRARRQALESLANALVELEG